MLAVDSRVGPEQILNDAKRKNSSLLYLHNTIEGAESRKRDMEYISLCISLHDRSEKIKTLKLSYREE